MKDKSFTRLFVPAKSSAQSSDALKNSAGKEINMRKDFVTYLNCEKEKCLEKGQRLILDERRDEANLCKVEANIYEVYGSLYQTACKQAVDGNDEMITDKFINLADMVSVRWKSSYETAKLHTDSAKMAIEEIKLGAVEKIMCEYRRQIGV